VWRCIPEYSMDVMAEIRHELANYRDMIEIFERIKRPESKKDAKAKALNKGSSARLRLGRLSRKRRKYLILRRQWI